MKLVQRKEATDAAVAIGSSTPFMGMRTIFWLLVLWPESSAAAAAAAGHDLKGFIHRTVLPDLQDEGGIWQRAPRLWRNVEGLHDASPPLFSFDDAVAASMGGLLDRASVAKAEGAADGRGDTWTSEFAPSRSADDLREFLRRGTLFFNGAGLDFPRLADLASTCQGAFGFPANVNVYMTAPGREVSVSPHTDMQDVLVFQTSGRKRWRVWGPPPRTGGRDPFGRGKNGDRIDVDEELGEPLLDTWLEPGCILYVPMGFPHATSTAADGDGDGDGTLRGGDRDGGEEDCSCHVTLNIDSYFYGLSFATLRAVAAARVGSVDRVRPPALGDETHRRLFAPLPLGFLRPAALRENGEYGEAFEAHVAEMLQDLNEEAAAECGVEAPSLGGAENVRECVRFLVSHWRAVTTPSKYANVRGPFPTDSPEAMQARMLKNLKNSREEAEQKKLGAFATSRAQ